MRFKVLGSIEVERDGSAVPIGGPQQRRLLGVLLIARGTRCRPIASSTRCGPTVTLLTARPVR